MRTNASPLAASGAVLGAARKRAAPPATNSGAGILLPRRTPGGGTLALNLFAGCCSNKRAVPPQTPTVAAATIVKKIKKLEMPLEWAKGRRRTGAAIAGKAPRVVADFLGVIGGYNRRVVTRHSEVGTSPVQ